MGELSHTKETLGAILLGCILSTALSGITTVQTFLYFRLYPKDALRIKLMVRVLLDFTHTGLICAATWDYLILNFGNKAIADTIPIAKPDTNDVLYFPSSFFSHRVFRLSKNNWYITAPLVVLSFGRLGAALVSTTEMGRLKSFHAFVHDYGYIFTLGLSLACTLDILITATIRTGFHEMDHIIDTIMLYTFNNGALTCATTVVSLICWVTMPGNLIFLGLHFAISKLYANSLLATLNSRRSLREHRSKNSGDGENTLPVLFPSCYSHSRIPRFQSIGPSRTRVDFEPVLEISIEKTIQCEIDDEVEGQDVGMRFV
ncbi:hypothetical protein B0F90DRAFT_1772820 [Multifurca ochricompacta]|uniref:DUF6534 domain-containing protein n=1 Tax=Multifurca ochricompacta TaxID=376703 RepID=A0AAD4LVB8_9AGAM|nr:hypothetical protein B0F90DRAFT_1772820 [Multifurca ochricompacta]